MLTFYVDIKLLECEFKKLLFLSCIWPEKSWTNQEKGPGQSRVIQEEQDREGDMRFHLRVREEPNTVLMYIFIHLCTFIYLKYYIII